MAKVPNSVETLPKISIGWLGRTSVTDRRQTDGRRHIGNVNVSPRLLKSVRKSTPYIIHSISRTLHY